MLLCVIYINFQLYHVFFSFPPPLPRTLLMADQRLYRDSIKGWTGQESLDEVSFRAFSNCEFPFLSHPCKSCEICPCLQAHNITVTNKYVHEMRDTFSKTFWTNNGLYLSLSSFLVQTLTMRRIIHINNRDIGAFFVVKIYRETSLGFPLSAANPINNPQEQPQQQGSIKSPTLKH